MKLPFTQEQFFEVFKNYNEAAYPIQILFYILSGFTIYLLQNPGRKSSRIINFILSFCWFWMGLVYHFSFFASINKAAYLFGSLFILQAMVFFYIGFFKEKISYKYHPDKYGITGTLLVLFALIGYPITGYFLGHTYPFSPTIGLPCPTTIFTFGLLLQTEKKLPYGILIIPLFWTMVGLTAILYFGMTEDWGLPASAFITVFLWISRNRKPAGKTMKAV
jgi:hypothetical protein